MLKVTFFLFLPRYFYLVTFRCYAFQILLKFLSKFHWRCAAEDFGWQVHVIIIILLCMSCLCLAPPLMSTGSAPMGDLCQTAPRSRALARSWWLGTCSLRMPGPMSAGLPTPTHRPVSRELSLSESNVRHCWCMSLSLGRASLGISAVCGPETDKERSKSYIFPFSIWHVTIRE